jgi:glucan biosynthesis protein
VSEQRSEKLPTGDWRANFVFSPARRDSELRLTLNAGGRKLTETWSYRWAVDSSGQPV